MKESTPIREFPLINRESTPVNLLLTGLGFPESPRWHKDRLWFANWVVGTIMTLDPDGNTETICSVPSFPSSIDWLPSGELIIVSGREKKLLTPAPQSALRTFANLEDHCEGGLNEIVIDGRGNIYTNGGGFNSDGIILLVTPDGPARQVADNIAFPNGMAITPDNSTLIIAESWGKKLTAFTIAPDGTLSDRRIWADLGAGTPDGICLDEEGAVWYADVPNKCCVRVKEGGEILQKIILDRGCFACALGGPDRNTLYITAAEWHGFERMFDPNRTGIIVAVEVDVPAAGWPGCSF